MKRSRRLVAIYGLCLLCLLFCLAPGCRKEAPPAKQADALPEDIKLYPNVKKELVREFGEDGAFQIRSLTDAEPENVLQHYENTLPGKKWQLVSRIVGQEYLLIFHKNKQVLRISLVPAEEPDMWVQIIDYGKE